MEGQGVNMLELLIEMTKDLAAMSAHQQEIKEDLKQHMKRTAILETEIKYLHKQVNIAHGAIALLIFITGLVKLVL